MSDGSELMGGGQGLSGDNGGAPSGPVDTGNAVPSGGAGDWLGSFPEEARGFVENKGWKEPIDVLKSYQQLEGFLGADKAGRGMVLPRDETDAEAYERIYSALGRPEKPEGYGLAESLAGEADVDPYFMETMAGVMHKSGLSTGQAQALAKSYQSHVNIMRDAMVEKHQAEVDMYSRTASPATIESARRGFRFLGLEEKDAAAIEMHFGVEKAAEIFAKIGRGLGEDSMPGEAGSGFNGSSRAAGAKIAELNADRNFRDRYLSGDPHAYKMMEDLHKRLAENY